MIQRCLIAFAFIIVLDSSAWAQSQEKIDSLLNTYKNQKQDSSKVNTAHDLYDLYYGHKPELAMQYSEAGLDLAKKLNYKAGIAKSYAHKGVQFKNTRQLDSALNYFEKARDLYKDLGDKHNEGIMIAKKVYTQYSKTDYDNALETIEANLALYSEPVDSTVIMMLLGVRGRIYMRQTRYKEGFEATLEALNIAKKIGDEDNKAIITGTLASLYHYTDNKQKSIALTKQTLEHYKKVNDKRLIALALNDIGNSNYVIENYDVALKYLEESLPISKEMKLHSLAGITLFNIGKTYIRKGSIKKGITHLEESIHYSKNISHNPLSESWALKKLGDVYTEELNQPDKALPYLNRAIILADSIGNKDDLYQAYRDRSEAYVALGQHKNALEDHITYKSINDSVYNIEKSKEIERLKTEFETKEREQEIALQKNEIGILEQKATVNSLQKWLLGGGLLLSIVAIGFGYYGFKQRIKRNTAEKEKLDDELAFKKKELTAHALHLAKKNEVLENLKQQAKELKKAQNDGGYQHLIRTIDFDLQDDNNWKNFSNYFQQVHKDFNSKVKELYPKISASELRFLSLVKMNLSSKEIASILNISNEGIKKARYRVRKKLSLNPNESLEDLILNL
ncbi:50S ribosomal protein L33 [Flavobacteriales bacterium ALC-1]|nr:50S ribosomal protein L33 [Flavobacteriales bacterium ALC-1]